MSELRLPRLLAAAKEFNIGQDTLMEFLTRKGFPKDDLKPTAKLTEEMYRALQAEFQSDKAAKNKADQVEIPRVAAIEKKKKDEEEISFKKEEKKPAVLKEEKEEIKEPAPIPEPEEQPKVKAEVPPTVVKEEEPVVQEVIKIEAPEIEGPKIIDRIDLSGIDSSTRPKKTVKKKEEPEKSVEIKKEKEKEEPKKKEAVPQSPPQPEVTIPKETQPVEKENTQELIKIEAPEIEGPKVVGKISLPIDSDTRPKHGPRDADRKRKRIPIQKSGGSGQGQPNQQNQARQQQQSPQSRGGFNQDQRQGQGAGHQGNGNNRGNNFQRTGTGGQQDSRNRGGGRFQQHQHRPHHEEKEIDAKEIQDKIRETQAKLAAATGRGKSQKAKHRREKRHEHSEEIGEQQDNKLQVTEFVTVSELANLMDVSFAEVISKCMSLGIMVSINQRLDAEVIELVAGEFGYEVGFISLEDAHAEEVNEEIDEDEGASSRAPIVTIMGHVDHGKTSLLDYIRNANVVAGEAGGITQHIGAYEVTLSNGKHITFLDTPGHEAFTAMRARGAKVTDLAVIVVAADDAVMPQTKEAISHAQAAGVPMIFAVNKIDKDGANPQKIYEQLSQMNLLVEEWGGKYQSQEISAKKGLNIDKLLEKILLEAELLDLKANPEKEATGTIIEASLDKGRGYVATILVQNGTLRQGDLLVSGQHYGRIKAMFNERNQRTQEAPPSTPVVVLGLNGAPQAGEKFKVYQDEGEAKEIANKRAQILREQGLRARKHITLDEIGRRLALGNFKELNIIIKGDVDGSVEALSDSLQKLSNAEIAVNIVHKAVGQISESDVLLATASDAILIGFNVRPSAQANRLAQTEGVEIKMYSIIYNAIEEVKSAMEGMLEPKVEEKEIATVEIREVYKFDKATVAGCFVIEGKVKRDSKIRLFRDGVLLYPRQEGAFAEFGSLKRYKDDVKEVASNMECGVTVKNFIDVNPGDTIIAYEEEEIKRTL